MRLVLPGDSHVQTTLRKKKRGSAPSLCKKKNEHSNIFKWGPKQNFSVRRANKNPPPNTSRLTIRLTDHQLPVCGHPRVSASDFPSVETNPLLSPQETPGSRSAHGTPGLRRTSPVDA